MSRKLNGRDLFFARSARAGDAMRLAEEFAYATVREWINLPDDTDWTRIYRPNWTDEETRRYVEKITGGEVRADMSEDEAGQAFAAWGVAVCDRFIGEARAWKQQNEREEA